MANINVNLPADFTAPDLNFWEEGAWLPSFGEEDTITLDNGALVITSGEYTFVVEGKQLALDEEGQVAEGGRVTGIKVYSGTDTSVDPLISANGFRMNVSKVLDILSDDEGASELARHLLRGDDTITGGAANDMLGGFRGDDRLYGMDGDDTLFGGKGRDRLDGGAGDDMLVGGRGRDMMFGGEGNDTFVFDDAKDSNGKRTDVIKDFAAGDKIDLTAFGFVDEAETATPDDGGIPDDGMGGMPGGDVPMLGMISHRRGGGDDNGDDNENEDAGENDPFEIVLKGNDSILRIDTDQDGNMDMRILVKNYVLTVDDLLL